ncbi:tyrosine-type recombinase/integrase [Aeromonas caviae]|uniref:tyrosine-type recombinase/integrase n=1 Tax=Aeromonas caviae TaxID=648 RepID=UPI002B499D8E|nr:site-specific integrase [Aeromonas caviae]
MAKVQERIGAKGKTYRVEFMRGGSRVSKTFRLKKDAVAFAAQITLNADLANTLASVELNTKPLSKVFAEYLNAHTGRDKSVPQRLEWWANTIGPDKLIGKITKQDIKKAMNTLESEGKAPATFNRYKAALSSVFEWFNNEYDTKHNPTREVRQKGLDNARTRFLSDEELPRLLAAAKASNWERLHLLLHMAITTGARRSELIGLQWTDINFTTRTAHLAKTKNGSQRVLSLTDGVIAELVEFRQVGNGYVFQHPSSLHGPFVYFDCYWRACRKEAGITDFRFHDLRHTCASLLAMNGASLLEIADVLGHKSLSMTQRYSHLCSNHKMKLTDRVFGELLIK